MEAPAPSWYLRYQDAGNRRCWGADGGAMAFLQSHLEELFQQSALFQLLASAVNGLLFFAIGMAFLKVFNRRPTPAAWTPVGPYFSAVAVIFALFLAFHASDIWSTKNQAERGFVEAGS